jgi:hypothetical protein
MKRACALLAAASCYASSLPEESTARLIEKRFPDSRLAYLVLDTASGPVICARWPGLERPAPLGSLLKPFVAVAYGETHGFRYPRVICRGAADRCWKAAGHGRLGLRRALAESCNAYFLALARESDIDGRRFGLPSPDPDSTPEDRIGLNGGWKISPIAIARAYGELRVSEVLEGLSLSAREGTSRALELKAYAKTGTAHCVHHPSAPGDGYAIALYPIDAPRYTVLVQLHGAPGAVAAHTAGRILITLRDGM